MQTVHTSTFMTKALIEQYGVLTITDMYNHYRAAYRKGHDAKPVKPQTVERYAEPGSRYEKGTPNIFKGFLHSMVR